MSRRVVLLRCALLSTVAVINTSCSSIDRLKSIGEQPPLSSIDNPTTKPAYKPVQMPMPTPQPATYNPNSLWRNGSRAFFKDQRAHQIGDILTVTVNINDTANVSNETQRQRNQSSTTSTIASLLGLSTVPLINQTIPADLLNGSGSSNSDGKGQIQRTDTLTTNVAAVVTQVLPNGNMVVEGKQEIRVNFEMRELI